MIDTIKENYQIYVNTFEEFLYRDHTSAMQLLRNSEKAAEEAYNAYEEYKKLAKRFGALRSSLYNSEEKYRNCKMYQKFLYTVSPLSWRGERQKFRRTSVFMMEPVDDDNEEEKIFGKYRLSLAEKGVSLNDILQLFREECMDDESPQLYFKDPEQLMDVFRFMEMQNLNSLLHAEELAIPLEHVKDGMRVAEKIFESEIEKLRGCIDSLSGGISWEENRAKYLEELAMDLIENQFKRLVMDDTVLNLHVYVEDVYETRIGPNDANLSMLKMMKAIEEKYRHELLSLDKVPSEQVQMLEGSCYEEQIRVMRLAEKAAKQYAELERLTYRLNKAFAPPHEKFHGKEAKKRSRPIEPPQELEAPPRSLTEEEEEYLEFFTDFCKQTDDPENYGINTKDGGSGAAVATPFYEQDSKAKYGRLKGLSVVERIIITNT
nr:cilia- and flagella-associated protein 100-like [Leptinotarsa decemlineata]